MHALSLAARLGCASLSLVAGAAPLTAAPAAQAAPRPGKKPLTHDAYDGWRSIQGAALSRNGAWLAYALHPQDGDDALVVRHLQDGREYRQERGREAVFSADGRFLAFRIAPPKAELDQAKKAKKKPEEMPKADLGVMDLATGRVETLSRVKAFKLPEEGGRFLAALLEKPEAKAAREAAAPEGADGADAPEGKEDGKDKAEPGTDLVILELGAPGRITIPEVAECLWSRDGAQLAYTVSPSLPKPPKGKDRGEDGKGAKDEKGNKAKADAEGRAGVFLWRPEGTLTLRKGKGHDRGLAFDRSGTRLAFLTDAGDAAAEAPCWALHLWTKGEAQARAVASLGTPGLPEAWAPSAHGRLLFTRDGARLFFGTAPRPVAAPKDAPEPVKVDLWHWKDPELQSVQKLKAEEERKRSYRAVLHLATGRCVQLGGPDWPEVETNENPDVALAYAPGPYRAEASWDKGYADVCAVDLASGARTLLQKRLPRSRASHLSPEGRWFAFFDGAARRWKAQATKGGAPATLGGALEVRFEQEDDDHPDLPDAYGQGGWTPGDRELLAFDRFDVWALAPDGTSRCLTQGLGRKERRELRPLALDPEALAVDLARPLWLKTEQVDTKATGYARLDPGQAPRILVQEDALLGARQPNERPTGIFLKAREAETVVLSRQRFDLFPDLWLTDLSFRKPRRLSDANPQQKGFRWGRQELVEYVNADGKPMKALLAKPEDFDPAKKYPLMVYIYEGYSDMLHVYQPPAPGTSINFTRFASNGYLVLRPDVTFEAGYPGKSSVKCVLPAIAQLVAKGFVDPERIGIQGHSWGGYQVAYLVAQTRLFKAAEAGATVSNMTSAYGGIRWGSGMSRAFQYEKGQSRLGDTPWGSPLQYLENSPLFWAERVQTPLLMIHNDGDDAVPWEQGIELFSALRRLGKPAWMFNYNGDKHNLVQRENLKHWTLHLCEFFDHLLLGAPRPAWMDVPVPYLERGKRDLKAVFGK